MITRLQLPLDLFHVLLLVHISQNLLSTSYHKGEPRLVPQIILRREIGISLPRGMP